MPTGLRIWDEVTHLLVLDTTVDRIAGGIQAINTGSVNGSFTLTPLAGQTVEWVYAMPLSWNPSGTASPWPSIAVNGNTISWTYNPAASTRMSVNIMGVTY